MQVAIEIRIQPKAGTDRACGVGICGSLPAPDNPSCAIRLDNRIDQRIAGKAAPSFKLGAESFLTAKDRQKIARTTSPQRTNKLGEKARGKGLTPGVQLDIRFGWHALLFHTPPRFCGLLALDRVNRRIESRTPPHGLWVCAEFQPYLAASQRLVSADSILSFAIAALRQELENAGH
jgi:hypothetical protein